MYLIILVIFFFMYILNDLQYGVKWAIIGSSPSGLPGVEEGSATNEEGILTLAPEFYSYAHPLKHTVSIDTHHRFAIVNTQRKSN